MARRAIGAQLLFTFLFSMAFNAFADKSLEIKPYRKDEILHARFGDKERQELFEKALKVRASINEQVAGQDHMALALQLRLVQWARSFGSRKNEPLGLNVAGLAGVGKTTIIRVLKELGLPVHEINAENYPGGKNNSSEYYLMQQFERINSKVNGSTGTKPLIVFVDELDKVPELSQGKKGGQPVNQPVISSLNEILAGGKLRSTRYSGVEYDFSNVFFIAAMNFSPAQIEHFAKEIVGEKKSYWDFTEDDMVKFDEWIRGGTTANSAIAKMLALLFRSNTVSRLVPDTIIAKALSGVDFDEIVQFNIRSVMKRLSQDASVNLSINYTPQFRAFLRNHTVFAPSGARMTVKRVDLLIEQLATAAILSDLGSRRTLALPRTVEMDFDEKTGAAVLSIQALSRRGRLTQVAASKDLSIPFNTGAGMFDVPDEVLQPLPKSYATRAIEHGTKKAKARLTSKAIAEHRAQLSRNHGLAEHLNSVIFDQDEIAQALERDLALYMNSDEEVKSYSSIAGFTGVGKTQIVIEAAKKLGIEVVRMNLKEYSAKDQNAADKFGSDLFERMQDARRSSPRGKVILLFEEIDKTFEIDPKKNEPVDRPVMAYVNELLDKKQKAVTIKSGWGSEQKVIDIRDVYPIMTLNFAIERFEVSADPQLTTIEDMQHLTEELSGTPASIRDFLKSMFLPETVNRLMSGNFMMAQTLSAKGYQKLITRQVNEVLTGLSASKDSRSKRDDISIEMSEAYLNEYLFSESVIPSEGGRQAELAARSKIRIDVIEAIQSLPKNSVLYRKPIQITLDFEAKSATSNPRVMASARLLNEADIAKNGSDSLTSLYVRERKLTFPSVVEFGEVEAKRVKTAFHEFGHAYAAVMHGMRFEHAVAVPPSSKALGYVKPRKIDDRTGKVLLSSLLLTIGSRAMERIFFSENPENADSVLDITYGPYSDNQSITKQLWTMLYELGMDPDGGIIERSGLGGDERDMFDHREYFFDPLPDEKISQLALVVKDLEEYLVEQFQQSHDIEWYKAKIGYFAQQGKLTEEQFYELIDYPYPGDNRIFVGELAKPHIHFANVMKKDPESVETARQFVQGNHKTAAQNLDQAMEVFKRSLKHRLHGVEPAQSVRARCLALFP